jgi:multimeric flavodoxin WrbA
MKVVLVNGSPKESGCTFTALTIVAEELKAAGMEAQIFQLGKAPMEGCRGCGYCNEHERCVIDDSVNAFTELAKEADGFVFGSPVHFASASGKMTSFLDRVYFSSKGKQFRFKPGAVLASARRAGTTATLDQLQKYLTYAQMPVVSSHYWHMVHGNTPDEVWQDLEGVQIMRVLARNMAWLLRSLEAGRAAGIEPFPEETRIRTNYIRP